MPCVRLAYFTLSFCLRNDPSNLVVPYSDSGEIDFFFTKENCGEWWKFMRELNDPFTILNNFFFCKPMSGTLHLTLLAVRLNE